MRKCGGRAIRAKQFRCCKIVYKSGLTMFILLSISVRTLLSFPQTSQTFPLAGVDLCLLIMIYISSHYKTTVMVLSPPPKKKYRNTIHLFHCSFLRTLAHLLPHTGCPRFRVHPPLCCLGLAWGAVCLLVLSLSMSFLCLDLMAEMNLLLPPSS